MLLLGVDFSKKKSGTLLEYMYVSNSLDPDQAHRSARPDLDPNRSQNQQRQKLSLARKELAKKVCFKKMKIQIVAIYIVDVQTGINVINFLSCMLNSTEY